MCLAPGVCCLSLGFKVVVSRSRGLGFRGLRVWEDESLGFRFKGSGRRGLRVSGLGFREGKRGPSCQLIAADSDTASLTTELTRLGFSGWKPRSPKALKQCKSCSAIIIQTHDSQIPLHRDPLLFGKV